jgi:hypothetical protein
MTNLVATLGELKEHNIEEKLFKLTIGRDANNEGSMQAYLWNR